MQNLGIEPEAFEICFAEVHSSGVEKTMHHQETEPAEVTRRRTQVRRVARLMIAKGISNQNLCQQIFTFIYYRKQKA